MEEIIRKKVGDVNKSVKYNKNLCIDCLKELILSSQNPSKDTE